MASLVSHFQIVGDRVVVKHAGVVLWFLALRLDGRPSVLHLLIGIWGKSHLVACWQAWRIPHASVARLSIVLLVLNHDALLVLLVVELSLVDFAASRDSLKLVMKHLLTMIEALLIRIHSSSTVIVVLWATEIFLFKLVVDFLLVLAWLLGLVLATVRCVTPAVGRELLRSPMALSVVRMLELLLWHRSWLSML